MRLRWLPRRVALPRRGLGSPLLWDHNNSDYVSTYVRSHWFDVLKAAATCIHGFVPPLGYRLNITRSEKKGKKGGRKGGEEEEAPRKFWGVTACSAAFPANQRRFCGCVLISVRRVFEIDGRETVSFIQDFHGLISCGCTHVYGGGCLRVCCSLGSKRCVPSATATHAALNIGYCTLHTHVLILSFVTLLRI